MTIEMNRRKFISFCVSVGLGATLLPGTLTAVAQGEEEITIEMIEAAEKLAGLNFSPEMRKSFVKELNKLKVNYAEISAMNFGQETPPSIVFNPVPPGYRKVESKREIIEISEDDVELPKSDEEIAFLPVTHLSVLIKQKKISSTKLTKIYLSRLKKDVFNSVVNLTEELAFEQARRADEEIATGKYRGSLHGIPWGAKDIISVKGYPTTWGAEPFRDQIIDMNATVYDRLTEAGAVLVAKLSATALAGGNAWWFGGETKNPWDTTQSASGSSSGSAAATAAGMVAFAIGTETQGSIINPSARCGITGLRPTFGRVSRHGIMPLSWTMDKVGPMCRTSEDCAIVFNAIYGQDGFDMSVSNVPFLWTPEKNIKDIRVGYLKSAFEQERPAKDENQKELNRQLRRLNSEALDVLRTLGMNLIEFELPESVTSKNISTMLHIESSAMFDNIIRDNRIDQVKNSNRPYICRVRRFTSAVDYLQESRVRTRLMQKLNKAMERVDLYIAPHRATSLTNHTGHPAMAFLHGFIGSRPQSLNLIGGLYKEPEMLSIVHAFQQVTDHHLKHPKLD